MPPKAAARKPSPKRTTKPAAGRTADLLDPLAVEEGKDAYIAIGGDQVISDLVWAEAVKHVNGDIESIACGPDKGEALAQAASVPGLFNKRCIHTTDLEAASAANIAVLVSAITAGHVTVVAKAAKLDAKSRRALTADQIGLYDCSAPTAPTRRKVLSALAANQNVTLAGRELTWLSDTLADDLARARSVITSCAYAGLTTPTLSQLGVLAGTKAGGSAKGPFELAGSIERSDVGKALGWLDESRADPFATLGYLRARFSANPKATAALFTAENGLRSARDSASVMDELVVGLCEANRR